MWMAPKECPENDEHTSLECNLVNFKIPALNPAGFTVQNSIWDFKTDEITFEAGVFIIFGTLFTCLSIWGVGPYCLVQSNRLECILFSKQATYIYFSYFPYHGLEIILFDRKLQIRGSIVTNQSWRAILVWLEMMARKVLTKLKPNFKKIRKIYLLCGVQVELVLKECLWN